MITNVQGQSNFRVRAESFLQSPLIEVIVQMAVRLLFIFGAILVSVRVCPFIAPISAIGSIFLSSFFYINQEPARRED